MILSEFVSIIKGRLKDLEKEMTRIANQEAGEKRHFFLGQARAYKRCSDMIQLLVCVRNDRKGGKK
jgi:hypothetical protein